MVNLNKPHATKSSVHLGPIYTGKIKVVAKARMIICTYKVMYTGIKLVLIFFISAIKMISISIVIVA